MKSPTNTANDSSQQPPADGVPAPKTSRNRIRAVAAEYVRAAELTGPVPADDLESHAREVLAKAGCSEDYLRFAAVAINNQIWGDEVAATPYDRRLLLLPQCLRDHENCRADMDEYGLVCNECGRCIIGEIKEEAERLGYAVLIAEGSPVVISLIASGKIDAVIGVSCLEVLEGVFPYMESGAIPGIAIPLLNDGCRNTSMDVDWVWETLYRTTNGRHTRINLTATRENVLSWFEPGQLRPQIAPNGSDTEELALEWMSKAGKRWRPMLLTASYQALTRNSETVPESVRQAAIAVECFHKASLVHDDIEDEDSSRYGEDTMHVCHGVPAALNIGDYLVGKGYRLLSEIDASHGVISKMANAVARGHTALCRGQGAELSSRDREIPLTVDEILSIFRHKTAPAFNVALACGALLAGADENIYDVLTEYTNALGIAYQIRDDLNDENTSRVHHPSILINLCYERADVNQKRRLLAARGGEMPQRKAEDEIGALFTQLEVRPAAHDLMNEYKSRAVGALNDLTNSGLKSLLRLLISKIFDDIEELRCCDEHQS